MLKRRSIVIPLLVGFLVVLPQSLIAALWEINEPLANSIFEPTANIEANGDAPQNTCIVVQVQRKSGSTWVIMGNYSTTTPVDAGSWAHAFEPPEGGWTTTNDGRVILRKCGVSTIKDSVSIKIMPDV